METVLQEIPEENFVGITGQIFKMCVQKILNSQPKHVGELLIAI